MPCRRHRTWHPTPSQYTDTGSTCRCAIHWCWTSHWNTQLPILMSWVRPDLPHTPAYAPLYAVIVVNSRQLSRKYHTDWVFNPGPVVCESITLSARPQQLQSTYCFGFKKNYHSFFFSFKNFFILLLNPNKHWLTKNPDFFSDKNLGRNADYMLRQFHNYSRTKNGKYAKKYVSLCLSRES